MLPLLAGVATGALAVVTFNNRKEIKDRVLEGASKAKEVAIDVKESAKDKIDCLTSKKEEKETKKVTKEKK